MANVTNNHAVRPPQAQSAHESRDHQKQQTSNDAGNGPAVRAYQRHAYAQSRRAKETARYHAREIATSRRAESDERTGPRTGDHRGKGEVV
jgi:hypothetical protein